MIKKNSSARNSFDPSSLKEFDGHEMVVLINDKATGLQGIVSLHSTALGPALGGTRMLPYPSNKAALRDVLNLSSAMSFKCALAGLPFGGGKAVIIDSPDSLISKKEKLVAYARMIEKLGGIFKTGTDVGITDKDVAHMARHSKHMLGVSKADRGELTTSKLAALGVYYAIEVSLETVFGSESVKGRKVAVKGLGKLGGELVRLLYENGAILFVSDIDESKCRKIKKLYPGVQVVGNKIITTLPVDVFAPCALGKELTSVSIKKIRSKIVAGGANNQLASDRVGDQLFDLGILYAPDYIANAGGLIYVADELENDGFQQKRVLERTANIKLTLREIFNQSQKTGIPTHKIANAIAIQRMSQKDARK